MENVKYSLSSQNSILSLNGTKEKDHYIVCVGGSAGGMKVCRTVQSLPVILISFFLPNQLVKNW